MSYTIAVTGKGGVGKTTFTGILILELIRQGYRPILAVDADPNHCLDAALGVKIESTIGRAREDTRQIAAKGLASGISKQQLLQLKISQSLVETNDFDLIAMGRPEGAGCYCYANDVLKAAIAKLSSSYPYVILDNEAGLENLSRRITPKVDLFVMVTDPSNRGLETIIRLHNLAREMKIEYHKLALVINRLRQNELPPKATEIKEMIGGDFLLGLPDDLEIAQMAEAGENLKAISIKNQVIRQIADFIPLWIER